MAAQDHLSQLQFPPLYHGTAVSGLKRIDARQGRSLYPGMSRSYAMSAHNYVTTDPNTAHEYAHHAAQKYQELGHEDAKPTVYEVRPAKRAVWEPDPNSGPGGWNDGPSRAETKEMLNYGAGTNLSLRFRDSLRVAREYPADSEELQHLRDEHMGM